MILTARFESCRSVYNPSDALNERKELSMRIYFILGALVIFIGSSSFAEPVSKHEATEEVMQYMKAHKALETAKFGVWSLFENMREAAVDKGAQTDEERSIEKKYFQKVNELIDREVTWEAVRPAFIGVFEEVMKHEMKGRQDKK